LKRQRGRQRGEKQRAWLCAQALHVSLFWLMSELRDSKHKRGHMSQNDCSKTKAETKQKRLSFLGDDYAGRN
jgi:hypothetical protein